MSKYTTTVKTIVESINNYDEKLTIEEKIDIARKKIFHYKYGIDENYKEILEKNILLHYYMSEIAHETVDLWLLRLESKMKLIGSKYNSLYTNITSEINPLYTSYSIEKGKRKNDGSQEGTGESNIIGKGKTKNIQYDTPDGSVEDLEDPNIASFISGNTSDTSTNSNDKNTQKINNVEDYIRNIKGTNNTYLGDLVSNYVSKFNSIDQLIINELTPLFFGLY